MDLIKHLGLSVPIIQAPMAGVSTPAMAAAVSNAGGLGSIAIGAANIADARRMIEGTRARTDRAFQVNVFVHPDPQPNPAKEAAWLEALRPQFERFDAQPPCALQVIYDSFAGNAAALELLTQLAPPVVSFHFGLPGKDAIHALKGAGSTLLATATNLAEAKAAEQAGIDAVVAQGYEAGGHRGMVDPAAEDEQLGTNALTRLLVTHTHLPVIAAGGIMNGAGIREVLGLGAVAAQLGTAFIACPESAADDGYRAALASATASATVMTSAISGRPARCLDNHFTRWGQGAHPPIPDYPIAYDAGKALHAAAKAKGEAGYGAQWAGDGAILSRAMPAAQLISVLQAELAATDPARF